MRTVDEILTGDALTWANMDADTLRREHELLRRNLETARQQIALWAPLVAWRHCHWAGVLAHNFAVGAALCRAHEIGVENTCDWACSVPCDLCWFPGCGRTAP